MGQLALTVVGGIVGSFFGMPMLGMMIGGMIGSVLFAPTIEGPRMSDLTVTVSTYGNTINELFGTCRLNGNVIWSSGIKETKHKKSAGKGGPKQTTYTYSASFAVAFCKGEANDVVRMWGDSKLIDGVSYDPSKLNQSNSANAIRKVMKKVNINSKKVKYRFYPGSETQLPDALIEADIGVGKTPAFRGLCYIVFEDFQLEDFGNRIPSITAEIAKIPAGQVPYVSIEYSPQRPDGYSSATIDWAGGVMYMPDSSEGRLYKYSTATMQVMGSVPWFNSVGGHLAVPPGGGYITSTHSPSNNVKYYITNTESGATATLGFDGNSLSDVPASECEVFSSETPRMANNGQALGFNLVDAYGNRTPCFGNFSVFGGYSLYSMTGAYIATGSLVTSGFNFGVALPGVTETSGTEIVVVMNLNGTVRYTRMTVKGLGMVMNVQKRPDCYGSVFSPGMEREDYVFGAIDVTTEIEKIVTTETDEDDSTIVHITTDTRDSYGNLSSSTITRDKKSTDTDGVETTYDTQTVTFDRFTTNFSIVDVSDNTLNMIGQYTKGTTTLKGFLRWSLDEKVVKVARVWNTAADLAGDVDINLSLDPNSRLSGGSIGWITYTDAFMVNVQTGHVSKIDLPENWGGGVFDMQGSSWDDYSQSLIARRGNTWHRFFFRSYGDGTSLASLVTSLVKRSNVLTEGDIDVEDLLNTNCSGYVVSNNSSVKDCLNQLSQAYFFDGVESDYTLKFVKRGGAPVATIPQDELAPADDQTMAPVKETKTQEPELAMRVTVNFYSFERDYQTGSQFAKRITNPIPTMYSPVESKVELPIVLTATEAKQIATKALQTVWTNRTALTLKMPWKYIALDPSDIINVTRNDGITYRVRTEKVDLGVDYTMEVSAVTEKAATYDASMVTADPGSFPVQWVKAPGAAKPIVLNTPLLRDLDDTQGRGSLYYLGFTLQSGEATVVSIEESKAGGSYASTATVLNEAIVGTCQSALMNVSYSEATDEISELIVAFNDPEITLETVSQEEVLAGANAAAVGEEVIQFREADQNDDGTWTLRGILRGRRGTQYAVANHAIGDRFVLLQSGTLETATHSIDDYSGKTYVRAVNSGTVDTDAEPITVDFEPNDLKPYTPEALKATSVGDDITVTYQRRSRITFGITDAIVNAPYYEGQGQAARIKWQAFIGAEMDDPDILAGTKAADMEGENPVFNPDGTNAPQSFTLSFPLLWRWPLVGDDEPNADYKGTSFILRIWETGFVDGRPKIVRFKTPIDPTGKAADGEWAYAELY